MMKSSTLQVCFVPTDLFVVHFHLILLKLCCDKLGVKQKRSNIIYLQSFMWILSKNIGERNKTIYITCIMLLLHHTHYVSLHELAS